MRNPLSLEAFRDWAARKPADEKYEYCDGEICAFAQYLNNVGFSKAVVDDYEWYVDWHNYHDGESHSIPIDLAEAVKTGRHTFGALTQRLNEAIAKEKETA